MKQATATPYIPAGFRSLTPYVIVPGAGTFIEFVKQAFDAEEVFRMAEPDGVIGHAEVRIGDSMLELSDGGEAWPPRPAAIHVYVPDADATYARAMAAGAPVAGRAHGHAVRRPRGGRHRPVRQQLVHRDPQGGRARARGLGTLTPTLHVKGTDRLIDFIKQAFGAEELDRTLAPGRHRDARPAQAGRLGAGAGRGARHREADALLRSTTTWRTWTASTRARCAPARPRWARLRTGPTATARPRWRTRSATTGSSPRTSRTCGIARGRAQGKQGIT